MNENKSSAAGMVGIILIITLILLGGLYFWGKRIEESKVAETMSTDQTGFTVPAQYSEATAIRSMSSSDDTATLQADIQNTKLDNLDAELK
jgi:hypothetical protein